MRLDIIIGVVVSIVFHAAFLWSGEFFRPVPPPPPPVIEDLTIEMMEMPEMPDIEIEDMEVYDASDGAAADISDLAPPSLMDTPMLVTVDSFVQQLQPPPPPGMQQSAGAISIPVNRPTGRGGSGEGLGQVFNLADLDQRPTPRLQSRPVYPFEMRRAGINGEVVVGFIVDTNGDVRDVYVVRSTQREFESAAIQAVSKWKFRPGRKGGRPANVRMNVPIVFNISDE